MNKCPDHNGHPQQILIHIFQKEQKDALHTHRERKNYICQLATKWKGQQKQMEYIHFECAVWITQK